ncbi:unnamed protein product [Linum trigynum]|uniref:RING-type domain-containing protein n=1 Tax=Linum trigynum TaxID=586398 RepID=A0AAV2DKE3_9ROSI
MGFRHQVEVKITSWVDMAASYISWVVVSGLARVGLLKSPAATDTSSEPSTTMDSYFVLIDGCSPMCVPVDRLMRVIKRCLPVITYASFLEKAGAGDHRKAAEIREINTCTVCMEGIMGEEEVRELCNCEHVFHRECLDHWVDMGRVTCPLCRAMLFPGSLGLAQLRAYSSPSMSSPDHEQERGRDRDEGDHTIDRPMMT